jgi:ketosteroid isomerase-like protein
MAITADYVRQVFKGLEDGDGAEFFKYVSDDVDWTVEGTHPLAGHYRSKANFVCRNVCQVGKSTSERRAAACRAPSGEG